MQVFSKDQAKYIDDVTIKSGKLSSIELMKNAGIKISGFLQKNHLIILLYQFLLKLLISEKI